MLNSSLSYIIIRSLPECILLIISSYILMNIKLDKIDILKKSILYLIILTLIRVLPINFGIHTVLSMFVLGTILYRLKGQDIINTILTISKIFICLAMSEGIYMVMANDVMGIPLKLLTDNTKIVSAMLTLPSLLIFFILVLIIKMLTNKIYKFYK
ncbi:hypothetical protein JGS6364_18961 [[Clostridium] sordellii]|uniref:Membrane protein n=2 Tax=Paraclostridium sordellii TaxID=1505 RepID=A0A9P1L186_PARSO|nr:hypothetical protein [Paeniclostridium sordellii]AUN15458.1 hypothetical protein RSJ16_14970 [Paeniclostridium sordellii]EPZ57092.1 putative membrane protein [[Clostridium] sordellii VPI 9048] [Paeniclostridium sordellii VPI 9048]CEJ74856.1 putative membrane protein [[Clostridium] sordellii] [Paeniclostridium sordellii]CEK31381.1 hypothetical protein JGS6364_18961 [[Clostridium] sordellii] [Paeniclostridium sordellii]CEK35601.1 hypothetical protein UMC2_24941 [[Clostridium] sordellii] [Paen